MNSPKMTKITMTMVATMTVRKAIARRSALSALAVSVA